MGCGMGSSSCRNIKTCGKINIDTTTDSPDKCLKKLPKLTAPKGFKKRLYPLKTNSPRRTGGNFLLTLKTTNMKLVEIRFLITINLDCWF